ncbi:Gfo/Idh/MocA family oxidoreductase [Chromobacterium vaccinii]|uniref:Gfo/Idh/MocA family oxidoreductase n=1 Tax=Chromobacterium vaccinii TaxID=1108595 RepID=UPI001E32D334|nr:Gfo/Idh/MocA family oxidoreductase [Chromobacterium vaccinii]MCD4498929.1 Gfo/Idh/MocA family oxidoreductase [Chromobacterium vaccinii]
MNQVAIIGAGQLGRRHLQGLVKSTELLTIHVVDPFEASRRAVEDFIASPDSGSLPAIHVHATPDALPAKLDLVIVATTASQRLDVIEQLVRVAKIRHLVLEKFLFNDSEQYKRAASLIAEHGIAAWVNTPRRHFSVYRELREQTRDDQLLQFTVDGGDWGLCCNSVHFVDLVQFLAGETELRALEARFDADVMASKRDGYVELTGEIAGEVGATRFTVRSIRGSTKPITVTLHYGRQTVLIAEGAGQLWRFGQGGDDASTFRLPYQSEMTGVIASQLLSGNGCDLTPYADSVAAHLPLLFAFAACAGIVAGDHAQCAIT